jgi:multidrug resistance efflux pump
MVPQSISSPLKRGASLWRLVFLRFLRLGVAFSAASVAGFHVWNHFQKVQSRQAFVNAEIIAVRNPIAGHLQLQNLQPGQWLTAGTAIGKVENLLQASEIEVKQQELKSRLKLNQQQIVGINQQISDRRRMLSQFSGELQQQNKLEVTLALQQVEEARSQVEQLQIAAKTAREEASSNLQLMRAGAIARIPAQQAISRSNQADVAVNSAQSRYQQARQRLKAVQAGLQLDGSRTLSYPEIRTRELHTEIADLHRQGRDLQVQTQAIQAELKKITQQLKINKSVVVSAPTTGAIWSVEAKPGEYIDSNTPIFKVLNCQNRWVDAFFSESVTKKLSPGTPVEVKLEGADKNQVLKGKIEAVRSGSGRVTTGDDVAVPPPDNARRQVAVRVKIDWQNHPNSVQFCDVGRSAEVEVLQK